MIIDLKSSNLTINDGVLFFAGSGPEVLRAKLAQDGTKVMSKLYIKALQVLVGIIIQKLEEAAGDPDEIAVWADDPRHDHVFDIDPVEFTIPFGYEPFANNYDLLDDEAFSSYFCGDDFRVDDPFGSAAAFTIHVLKRLNDVTCELDYFDAAACEACYYEHPLMVFLGYDGMTGRLAFSSKCLLKLIASTIRGKA